MQRSLPSVKKPCRCRLKSSRLKPSSTDGPHCIMRPTMVTQLGQPQKDDVTSDDKLRSYSFHRASFGFDSQPFPFLSEQFAKLSERSVAAYGCIARTRGRVLPCPHGGHWPSPRATLAALVTKTLRAAGTLSKRRLGSRHPNTVTSFSLPKLPEPSTLIRLHVAEARGRPEPHRKDSPAPGSAAGPRQVSGGAAPT